MLLLFIGLVFVGILNGEAAGFVRIMSPKNDTVFKKGDDIEIKCEGKGPVSWLIDPFYNDSLVNILHYTKEDDDYKYKTVLTISNVRSPNTAYYYCLFNDTDKSIDEWKNSPKVTFVYLYVSDPNNLFSQDNLLVIRTGVQYGYVNFPCRPSNPNVQVSLSFHDAIIYPGINTNKIKYNQRDGFTLGPLNMKDAGIYCCNTNDDPDSCDMEVSLYLLDSSKYVPAPNIPTYLENVVEYETITIICDATVSVGTRANLEWKIPDHVASKPNHVIFGSISSSGSSQYMFLKKNLTINNVEIDDEGSYTCVITDHNNNKNNHTKMLTVIHKNFTYIDIDTKNATLLQPRVGDKDVKWIIYIKSHPEATVEWFGPFTSLDNSFTDKPIFNSSTHEVINSPSSTKLTFTSISIGDRGMYILKVSNKVETKTINLTLSVSDQPTVEFLRKEHHGYFIEGQNYSLECIAAGYPLANIKWYFKQCKENYMSGNCLEEKQQEIEQWQYHTQEVSDVMVSSKFNVLAKTTGILVCEGENALGKGSAMFTFIVTDVCESSFCIKSPFEIVEEENVTLTCAASRFNYTGVQWYKNDQPIYSYEGSDISDQDYISKYTLQQSLVFKKITAKSNGTYVCKTHDGDEEESYEMIVKQKMGAQISETNLNESTWYITVADPVRLICVAVGRPKAVITWWRDNEEILPNNDLKINFERDNTTLFIQFFKHEHEGIYECVARNRHRTAKRTATLYLKDTGSSAIIATLAVLFIIGIAVLSLCLFRKMKQEKKLKRQLTIAGLNHFPEGAMENINPDLPIDEQADLLPYDTKYEFPREKLKLGKQLGSGAFGVVLKAEACGIVDGEPISVVAVKMVKRNANYSYIKALASELKIMVHLGKHLNVVNLLGACTGNIIKKELLVIVEFCRYGNLHNYLIRHRDEFINQIDPHTGIIDPSIGAEILSRSWSVSSKTSNDGHVPGEPVVDYRAVPRNSSSDSAGECQVSMAPTGEDACLMSNNSAQPEWRSNYHGDYKGKVRPICTRDLICWAFQVARGMDYLASRKVLHGDLAARNILLADDNVVKICDFGLAKSMYKSDNYKKKGDGPLPVKWLAIESIRDKIFSTQSDIWSFGIVLWEFFSLARTPYPGMEANERFYNKLEDGYRMEKPDYATNEIYQTMLQCWHANPNRRPLFSELVKKLGDLLEDSVRNHYIDLNDPYMEMNSQWRQDGHDDYLAMMNSPTYGNLVSPNDEDSDGYLTSRLPGPSAETSGYLSMKSPTNFEGIFSPRQTEDNIFSFNALQQKRLDSQDVESARGIELDPILKKPTDKDSGIEDLSKASNEKPTYVNLDENNQLPVSVSQDNYVNYVNLPQHKNSTKPEDCKGTNENLPTSFSNPTYIGLNIVS